MTAFEIARIACTVTVTQVVCDLLARRWTFDREPYKRALSSFERALSRRDRLAAAREASPATSAKSLEKASRKAQRAEDDVAEAAAQIAQRHTRPGMATSAVFLVLYRVLDAEYGGRPVAVLPFSPWSLVQRLSSRGVVLDEEKLSSSSIEADRACSFLFVYVLCTLSFKFVANRLCGVRPPKGADRGVMNVLDAPGGQRALQSLGIDTDELNEARKMF